MRFWQNVAWQTLMRTALCVSAMALGACASDRTATPPSEFPTPVMAQLQMTVALDIDDNFRNFIHSETLVERREQSWTLPIGPASVDWVQGLMQARFVSIAGGRTAPLRFKPQIERVEFSLPTQTGTPFYEAWIQYRILVFNAAGQEVANWAVAAYGKARDSTMLSAEVGMGRALNQAMRDATAATALELQDTARLSSWTGAGA